MSTQQPETIVLATHNQHKAQEFGSLLQALPVRIQSLREWPLVYLPPETGVTFAENAALKAEAVAHITGQWALADDSGLCVDALGGAPGVYSARYAGVPSGDPRTDDRRNNEKLLCELSKTNPMLRSATFVCVLALARPDAATMFFEGRIDGMIADAPRGDAGFGYDPLFVIPALGRTFAELSAAEKHRVSHRAQAVEQLSVCLLSYRSCEAVRCECDDT